MAGLKQGCTLKSGKYKIVKTLGQGSFGITYLATTKVAISGGLGEMDVTANVTIKEFFMSDINNRATDGTYIERTNSTLVKNYLYKFQKEAENLSKLHHPNIVRVIEVFDENNTTYYVMEYIDGETIDEYIKQNRKLSVEESLKITKEVCSALSYMHEHKMLHLDLKPKNIMRDSKGHIYLIDFGLAKQYNDNGEPESSTSIGLGTPGYAPIEQASYKQDGTLPVTLDIYALGASLYKMLTGKTPPESSHVLNDGLPLDELKQASVGNNIIAIVEKAMAALKKDRYQTVTALLEDVSTFSSSNDEQTEFKDAEERTIIDQNVVNKKEEVEKCFPNFQALLSKKKSEKLEDYEEKTSLHKKYKWSIFLLIVFMVFIPVSWRFYDNISSKAIIEKEARAYLEVLDTKDTLIIKKYLSDFENASKEHKSKAQSHYEALKTVDYINKHMVNIPHGTAPNYGIYYRYVHGDDWNWYKVGNRKGGSVASFQLFQYEVTNKIWIVIMGHDGWRKDDNKPVNVSYDDCMKFIEKLNKLTGKKYRLPTITEWLSAASPDTGKKISELGWFRETGHSLHNVGMKTPNAYGLYDMIGNEREWCQERFDINKSETQVTNAINGKYAAACGGQFDGHANSFPYLSGTEIEYYNGGSGFRIARDN